VNRLSSSQAKLSLQFHDCRSSADHPIQCAPCFEPRKERQPPWIPLSTRSTLCVVF
jgi:hypothetical protein